MKVRISLDVDITGETITIDAGDRIPVDITNAAEWFMGAFDFYPENFNEGFVSNFKAEILKRCTCGSIDGECPITCIYGGGDPKRWANP